MVFSSLPFIFIFLAVTLALYYLIPSRAYRNIVLLIVSLFFYAWGEPTFVLLMIFSIAINYTAGLLVEKYKNEKKKARAVLTAAIVINLLLLAIFKYTGLFVDSLKSILPFMRSFDTPIIPLPIGISFYTFQAMSYVIDVYRRETGVQRNPLYFGAYVTLFPQLIAGPIVRYRDVADQMVDRSENMEQFISGIKLFTVGLAKKVLIANQLASLWQVLKTGAGTNGILGSWIGIIAFSLQIYFDFGGYSDMAIGLGRMLGFEFLKNFDYPYISKSISEFWRRWHISLGTWFREYVYIPLGGNRKGLPRTLVNLMVVWGLTGLWHGASWNFALWGLYFGILLILERLFLGKWLEKLPKWLSNLYMLVLVVLGWALFDFTEMSELGPYLASLFTVGKAGVISHDALVYAANYLPVLIAACIGSTPIVKKLHDGIIAKKGGEWLDAVLVAAALILCTAALVNGGYNPFIYFRF